MRNDLKGALLNSGQRFASVLDGGYRGPLPSNIRNGKFPVDRVVFARRIDNGSERPAAAPGNAISVGADGRFLSGLART